MSSSILVENIRKTESIVLNNSNNQPDEKSLLDLWNSQVGLLRSAIHETASSISHQISNRANSEKPGGSAQVNNNDSYEIVIILDIEGTITPLYFVTKILFPFFIQNCESFVKKHLTQKIFDVVISKQNQSADNNETNSALEKSMMEVANEFIHHFYSGSNTTLPQNITLETFQNDLIQDSLEHTRENRKIPYMKKLQGICWHQAYLDGSIVGDIFSDVVPFLESTSINNHQQVQIYSSGSIFAQKLLLGYSCFGNLIDDQKKYNIRDFHDTVSAGMKGEASSYQKIYDVNTKKSNNTICVFVSDSLMELRAARKATLENPGGCFFVPVFAVRPQNPVLPEEEITKNDSEFVSIFTMTQVTEALSKNHHKQSSEENNGSKVQNELERMRKDVQKYNVTENEERKIF